MEDEEEQMVEESYQIYLLKKAEKEKSEINDAKKTRQKVNDIEEWLKTEYPDIIVDYLRDCGTRVFYFKDQTDKYRLVSLIQIPVRTKTYSTDGKDFDKLICYYDKVIFNVTGKEFTLDEFAIAIRTAPNIVKEYIDYCRKNNLAGILKHEGGKPLSMEDIVTDLAKKLVEEFDRETMLKIAEKFKKK
jgi:hypothetical protein